MTPIVGREAYNYIVDNWNIFCSFSQQDFSSFNINGINCWTIDRMNTCAVVSMLVKTTCWKQTPAPGVWQSSSCACERECFWPPVCHHLGHLPYFYQPELLPPVLQVQASSPVLFISIDLLQCGLCRVTGLLQSQQVQPKSGVGHPQQLLHPPVLHIPAIICKDLQSTMARQVYTYICLCVKQGLLEC